MKKLTVLVTALSFTFVIGTAEAKGHGGGHHSSASHHSSKNIPPVRLQVARLGKEAALMDAGQGVGQVTARAMENALVGKIDSF